MTIDCRFTNSRLRDSQSLLLQISSHRPKNALALQFRNSTPTNLYSRWSVNDLQGSGKEVSFNHALSYFDLGLESRDTDILRVSEFLCGSGSPQVCSLVFLLIKKVKFTTEATEVIRLESELPDPFQLVPPVSTTSLERSAEETKSDIEPEKIVAALPKPRDVMDPNTRLKQIENSRITMDHLTKSVVCCARLLPGPFPLISPKEILIAFLNCVLLPRRTIPT